MSPRAETVLPYSGESEPLAGRLLVRARAVAELRLRVLWTLVHRQSYTTGKYCK